MNNNEKTRFYLDKTGFFAESAMIFLVLAAVFRFFGFVIVMFLVANRLIKHVSDNDAYIPILPFGPQGPQK